MKSIFTTCLLISMTQLAHSACVVDPSTNDCAHFTIRDENYKGRAQPSSASSSERKRLLKEATAADLRARELNMMEIKRMDDQGEAMRIRINQNIFQEFAEKERELRDEFNAHSQRTHKNLDDLHALLLQFIQKENTNK